MFYIYVYRTYRPRPLNLNKLLITLVINNLTINRDKMK